VDQSQEARETHYTLDCGAAGLEGHAVSIDGLADSAANVIVEYGPQGDRSTSLLHSGNTSLRPAAPSSASVPFAALTRMGAEHLLGGFDHVLFLVGLLLLVAGWRALIAMITAFTVGHSMSLALSVLGGVSLPTVAVELAIAGSLFIVAHEALERRRWSGRTGVALCALFGLVHGLGFAGAFADLGLSGAGGATALFGFNLGVELGQLAVVGGALAIRRAVAALPRVRGAWIAAGRAAAAYAIGAMSTYYMLQRVIAPPW